MTKQDKADLAAEELRTEDDLSGTYSDWDELEEARKKTLAAGVEDSEFVFRPKTAVKLGSGALEVGSNVKIVQAEDGGPALDISGNTTLIVTGRACLDNNVFSGAGSVTFKKGTKPDE